MERKNIFQLVNEHYDIVEEVYKIYTLFNTVTYLTDPMGIKKCTLKTAINALFCYWKHANTCLDVDEFLQKANANIDKKIQPSEQQITNYLEALENFIYLYNSTGYHLSVCIYDSERFNVFLNLIDSLEKQMGLIKKTINDIVLLYHKNGPLEQVVNITNNKDIQWELICYVRKNLSLDEKRKSLAYFATQFYIEQDDKEKDTHIQPIMKDTTNILNSIQIRHNNETGKWEKSYIKDITDEVASALCDMAFNNILAIVLLREQEKYKDVYKSFRQKQKQDKKKS